MVTVARIFDEVSRYVGWGDPNGHGLWFIGIEEGSYEYTSETDVARRLQDVVADGQVLVYPSPGAREQFAGSRSQIPEWTAKIASAVSRKNPDWRPYLNDVLWRSGSCVFNANLYPLPKKRVEHTPQQYAGLFGIDAGDFKRYYKERCSDRHRLLREYWKRKQPLATICFGKRHWSTFREVFEATGTPTGMSSDGNVECYATGGRRVILTPFFGTGHMSQARVDFVAGQLNVWGVVLP